MYCNKCGNNLPEGAVFCNKCGGKIQLLNDDTNVHKGRIKTYFSKKKIMFWVLPAVLLVIIAGIIVFALTNKKTIERNDYFITKEVTYYSSNGEEPLKIWRENKAEFYATGAKKMDEQTIFSLEGEKGQHTLFNYSMPSESDRCSVGKDLTGTCTLKLEYDSEWRIKKLTQVINDETTVMAYSYDKSGNIIETKEYMEGSPGYIITSKKYNKYNVVLNKTVMVKNENEEEYTIKYKYKYEYDSRGLPETVYEYQISENGEKLNTLEKYKRDSRGLIIEEEKTQFISESFDITRVTRYEKCLLSDLPNVTDNSSTETIDKTEDLPIQSEDDDATPEDVLSVENIVHKAEYAETLFKNLLDGSQQVAYADETTGGCAISIGREAPSQHNNYANYSISGYGFSTFYDSDCIERDDETLSWYFENGGTYYGLKIYDFRICYILSSNDVNTLKESWGKVCGCFLMNKKEGNPEDYENEITDTEYLCEWSSDKLIDSSNWGSLRSNIVNNYPSMPAGRSISQMIVNEIYARHGYIFNTDEIAEYFSQKKWYIPKTGDMNEIGRMLNGIEQQNIAFLKTVN